MRQATGALVEATVNLPSGAWRLRAPHPSEPTEGALLTLQALQDCTGKPTHATTHARTRDRPALGRTTPDPPRQPRGAEPSLPDSRVPTCSEPESPRYAEKSGPRIGRPGAGRSRPAPAGQTLAFQDPEGPLRLRPTLPPRASPPSPPHTHPALHGAPGPPPRWALPEGTRTPQTGPASPGPAGGRE